MEGLRNTLKEFVQQLEEDQENSLEINKSVFLCGRQTQRARVTLHMNIC